MIAGSPRKAKRPKVSTRASATWPPATIIEVTGDGGIGLLIEVYMFEGRLILRPYRADPQVHLHEIDRVGSGADARE